MVVGVVAVPLVAAVVTSNYSFTGYRLLSVDVVAISALAHITVLAMVSVARANWSCRGFWIDGCCGGLVVVGGRGGCGGGGGCLDGIYCGVEDGSGCCGELVGVDGFGLMVVVVPCRLLLRCCGVGDVDGVSGLVGFSCVFGAAYTRLFWQLRIAASSWWCGGAAKDGWWM